MIFIFNKFRKNYEKMQKIFMRHVSFFRTLSGESDVYVLATTHAYEGEGTLIILYLIFLYSVADSV